MKTNYRLTAALFLALSAAKAGPLLTLNPASGALSGPPGAVIGWGFTLAPDPTYWTSVVGVILLNESDPYVGTFLDFIGPQGGPVAGALAPGSQDWTESFDADQGLGFGSYTIDAASLQGSNSG